MIARHRNRAIFSALMAVAVFLLAAGVFSWSAGGEYRHRFEAVVYLLVFAAFGLYIYAGIELAWAKGYQSAEAPVIVLLGLFCVPFILPLMPLIVLFGFKDKERRRRHRRPGHRSDDS